MNGFRDLGSLFGRLPNAIAFIEGSSKYPEISGRVMFYGGRDSVLVCTEVNGLPKSKQQCRKPIFAYHIHSGGECSGNKEDPFADVMGHFSKEECPHPYHSGDMPPLFGVDGKAFSAFLTDRFSVSEIIGKTVIIHLLPDDFATQPSGNAGEKIACGVITPVAR